MRTRLVGLLTPSALLGFAVVLCGFRPFTEVKNVCPSCPDRFDEVVMKSGSTVRCNVVAQNDDYWVLERYGEYRAAAKSAVASVQRQAASGGVVPSSQDQVLLDNGTLLHGTIVREQPGRYVLIQMGKWQQAAWVNRIKAVHKAGKAYPFK